MNKNDIWQLFKMTGKIEYFIKYKKMQEKGIDYIGNNESKRNNS